MLHAIDLSVFYSIFSLSQHAVWIDWLIIFVGEYLPYPLLLVFAYRTYREWRDGQVSAAYGYCMAVVAALVARFGVAEAIRLFFHRPRPYLALHLPHLLTDTAYSFPSGHMIFLFALATGAFFVNRKFAYWVYALGILIGLARVAAGVHYPSDILGGAALGIGTGYVVCKAWEIIRLNTKTK